MGAHDCSGRLRFCLMLLLPACCLLLPLAQGFAANGLLSRQSRAATACGSVDCTNGGVCNTTAPEGPVCECPKPYTGANCSVMTNYCEVLQPEKNVTSFPVCENRGTCSPSVSDPYFFCMCSHGFTGFRCQQDIDECSGTNPCVHGRCNNTFGSFVCECYKGWEHRYCDINPNDCPAIGVCQNGGVCVDGNSTYSCNCSQVDYGGANCTDWIDNCASSPCKNGGKCIDKVRSFACNCTDTGFTGATCETNIDDCAAKPCRNGRCVDLVKDFRCKCYPGWEGDRCQANQDDCPPDACFNDGRCVDGNGTYSCDCSHTDYTGENCTSWIDNCDPDPCQNDANCTDGLRDYSCDCSDSGFYGKNCSLNIDDCTPNPCKNGATCMDAVKNYSCVCYAGYYGRNCSHDIPDCSPNPCPSNAACLERSNVSFYGIPSLPEPFNGRFHPSWAAGYVCDSGYGYLLHHQWNVGIGIGSAVGFVACAVLAVGVFLLLLHCRRKADRSFTGGRAA